MKNIWQASEKLINHLQNKSVQDEISETCMICGKQSDIWEFIWTGDTNSCEGFEFWSYCPECEIDTFHRIPLFEEI